jgi:hypothetical protein
MQYNYPKVTNGYRWNLLKRCLYEIGIEPECVGDMGDQTFLTFSRELDDRELHTLDGIMSNDPQNQNPLWDSVIIKDLEAVIEEVREETGILLMPFYTESEKGSGVYNLISLCSKETFTDKQKETIRNAYHNLFVG